MRFNELISGAKQDVVIKIFGEDLDQLDDYAGRVGELVKGLPGATDLYVERATGQSQIVAQLDREKLAQYGLSVDDVNRTVQTAFAGQVAGQVFEKERRFDLVVRLKPDYRQDISNLRQLFIAAPDGRQIPLEAGGQGGVDFGAEPDSARRCQAAHHRGLQRAGPRRGKPGETGAAAHRAAAESLRRAIT